MLLLQKMVKKQSWTK